MNSPLGSSPKLAAVLAKFRNRVPKQAWRGLTLYLTVVLVFFFILNGDILFSFPGPLGLLLAERDEPPPKMPGSSFPQKIWQTWKIDPLLFGIRDTVTARTWLTNNPQVRYEVITDSNEMTYVEEHFGPNGVNRPDIVNFYRSVKLPIIKADLLRYMIMYADGGVYADIDVEAIKPLHRFFPERWDEKDYDIIVGVETDQPEFKDHPILGKKSMTFCQWTIVAKPGQPVFLKLVENIMSWFTAEARKQGVPVGQVELDFDQVISGTGPSAFTTAMLEEMNRRRTGRHQVTWDAFHDLDESKVVGRILVLNVEAFCAGQGHSDSGNHGARHALVKHHYHASSWPSRHKRFAHPAYGQVEDCNWNRKCVDEWDANVAAFETMSVEEKREKIRQYNALLELRNHQF